MFVIISTCHFTGTLTMYIFVDGSQCLDSPLIKTCPDKVGQGKGETVKQRGSK